MMLNTRYEWFAKPFSVGIPPTIKIRPYLGALPGIDNKAKTALSPIG